MKNFSQFIKEEVSIKGNKGLPEEKLRDIERKGAEKIRGEQPGGLIGQIRGLMGESGRFITGNQKKLEKLAEKVLRDTYPLILKNVDLDLQIVTSGGKVADFMKKEEEEKKKELKEEEEDKKQAEKEKEEEEEQEESDEQEQQEEELDKDALKLALDKRKFANNIIQGEAKNTKFILHQDITRDGLAEIYGDRAPEAIRVWNEISKVADKLDWIIPIEHKAQMMERQPEGMAGATSARFKKKAISKKKKKEQKDLIDEIKKSIEEGKDIKNEEMQKKISEVLGYLNPTVKVRAVDFPMLLHEAVKGVYELIADVGMSRDERMAKEVHRQTSTFLDEAEDFRYGPYLAQDLNDFVMKNPDAQKYPNIKEYVFGKLIDSDRWSDDECLENLKNIFLESPRGRKLLDDLITETIDELDNYQRQMSEFQSRKKETEEAKIDSPEPTTGEEEEVESDIDQLIKKTAEKEQDYSEMTKRELQDLIDDALDAGDFDRVRMLAQYLGESAGIYLNELERINESHQYHGRRN
jgi:hypothetical protein